MGGVILATVPFAVWPGGAVGTFTDMFSKVMLIFVLMVNTLTSPKRVERFVWLLVLASGYLASRAVIDYARGVNMLEVGRVQGSVGGMFRNPNDLALNMVTVIPLAAMLALQPISAPRRLIAAGSMVAMLGAIVASQSRGGTVGLAAMLVVLGLWLVRRRPGLVFGVCLVGVLASPLVPDSYWQRVATIVNKDLDTGGSREARTALNREAWAAFLEHPLTGVGAGNFPVYRPESRREAWREVHNVVLQVASELGVFGLMVFLFLVGSALYAPLQAKRLLRRVQRGTKGRGPPPVLLRPGEAEWLTLYSAAISATVVGWFICALFAPVAYHWTFYYVLALAVAPRDYLYGRLAAGRTAARASGARQISTSGAYA
jgi:O-antigen ligase